METKRAQTVLALVLRFFLKNNSVFHKKTHGSRLGSLGRLLTCRDPVHGYIPQQPIVIACSKKDAQVERYGHIKHQKEGMECFANEVPTGPVQTQRLLKRYQRKCEMHTRNCEYNYVQSEPQSPSVFNFTGWSNPERKNTYVT